MEIGTLPEPFRGRFISLIETGAAAVDIVGQDIPAGASDAFIERELGRPREHQRNICRYLQHLRPARILDVGCGTGGLTVALCATFPGASVVGVDAVPVTIEAARVRAAGYGAGAEFHVVDRSGPLPFADGAFDLVTCTSVIEFITEVPARRRFARELTRVSRANVLVTTPNPLCRMREQHTRRWLGDLRRHPEFPWASTPGQLDEMFEPFVRQPVPERARDKLRARWLPARVAHAAEIVMPWQFALYRSPASRC